MKATLVDRFFGDEPTHDRTARVCRLIGTIIGLSFYPMFIWITIDGLLRAP